MDSMQFDPSLYLAEADLPGDAVPPDLLILNQPIASFEIFARLWKHSIYRICADGGANRLYDMFKGPLEVRRVAFLPDAIHGDLDSLREDVRSYYTSHGVVATQDHDQYSTDFGKAMGKISTRQSPSPRREILVLGTLAGRVDQGLGLLHEMIREETEHPHFRLWLFSESSVSFILRSTNNLIQGTSSSRMFTPNVGLLPIYGPAIISTTGLEWDVKVWDTQMGYQVSTSNHVVAEEIQVRTNAPILFTIERAELPEEGIAK
ncbi:thiamin pyrophosphokinase-like protein 1 [Clohesyomyces aquaticus]|uniref:Thiamine pyrophosphokinase n=1 Tax=Clohesyomyces aquaticus TaxID=1231657 RepID=A0A1Y1ZEV0_9PLEO|nr:thiamin pyrophosphokinase-like protein 1 [Clohesyomyces aquaticus]